MKNFPKNIALLDQALTHKSYVNELGKKKRNAVGYNQRLEFLGDAVLGIIIAQYLYINFPTLDEGKLTKMESFLVCADTLTEIGNEISLGELLLLGKGELATGGSKRASNVADAMEAFIGALFLTFQFKTTNEIVLRLWKTHLQNIDVSHDYKSRLQEWLAKHEQTRPEYKMENSSGLDHKKIFTVGLYIRGELVQTAKGSNRKKAEQQAALLYLQKMGL